MLLTLVGQAVGRHVRFTMREVLVSCISALAKRIKRCFASLDTIDSGRYGAIITRFAGIDNFVKDYEAILIKKAPKLGGVEK